jgi:hypothetical protein
MALLGVVAQLAAAALTKMVNVETAVSPQE